MRNAVQYIYKISNILNDKFYVGRTNDINRRWKTHLELLNKGSHHSSHFQNAWNKYDKSVWSFEIYKEIDTGADELDLNIAKEIEQSFLDELMPKNQLYNRSYSSATGVLKGEEHPFYNKHPSEWMGDGFKRANDKLREKVGDKNSFFGKHHSEETKAILREKCPNYGEDNGFYGKTHTDESLEKMKVSKDKYSKPILINGVKYRSIRDAARQTGKSREFIKYRLKLDKFENYTYL
jgi:group I intron endonuclease